jgi:hypothetical protein
MNSDEDKKFSIKSKPIYFSSSFKLFKLVY